MSLRPRFSERVAGHLERVIKSEATKTRRSCRNHS
jgi:hypothetical protein